MKSILSFFAVIYFSFSVFASNEPNKAFQTMDLKQFDNLKEQSNVKIKTGMTCKTDSGLEYKAGEMGYDQCVKAAAQKSENKDGSKSQNNGTVEFTF